MPIESAGAFVSFPVNISESGNQSACFTGVYGSEDQNCRTYYVDGKIEYVSNDELSEIEGLTVILGWPKGIVTPPDSMQQLKWFLADNWPLFFPVIVFLYLTIGYLLIISPKVTYLLGTAKLMR